MQDCEFLFSYNEKRWRKKIQTLHYLGFRNVYTWLVDDTPNTKEINNLITTPDNHDNWKVWMDLHKEYWIDPDFNPPLGDWHFNADGHVKVADRMYEFICRQQ